MYAMLASLECFLPTQWMRPLIFRFLSTITTYVYSINSNAVSPCYYRLFDSSATASDQDVVKGLPYHCRIDLRRIWHYNWPKNLITILLQKFNIKSSCGKTIVYDHISFIALVSGNGIGWRVQFAIKVRFILRNVDGYIWMAKTRSYCLPLRGTQLVTEIWRLTS